MTESESLPFVLGALVLGYLFGSIPFGLIFTRMAGLGDIRNVGSGNIGATNVLRTGRKGLAAATLVADALKGTIPVLIAWRWGVEAASVAAMGAFLGHLFPVWLGFRGGKGVATLIGVLIGLKFPAALVFAAIWLAVAFGTRYSSLSSLLASAASPVVLWLLGEPRMAGVCVIMTALLWWKHRENIERLLARTEGRIGSKG
ncbi:MAG: glycerol-3-phosphate 1-O-acyltransferase PlsY [Microvirga sp.]